MTRSIHLPISQQPDMFGERLRADGQRLERESVATLQINMGKLCNLACKHCHVEAGPNRTEVMGWDVMEKVLAWFDEFGEKLGTKVVDLTGGAPEMNPYFQQFVREWRRRGVHVINRCNLVILMEAGYEGLVDFFAENDLEITASLPCYMEENVDKQRGKGVFHKSIDALHRLNARGYGKKETGLKLDLVYNSVGYGLPPEQEELEKAYKERLREDWGIEFNRLWTITNMPIKRFKHALDRDGEFENYMKLLVESHNGANLVGVMCRGQVSVGYEGSVYDCDFNQMLSMPIDGPEGDEAFVERESKKLWHFTGDELIGLKIRTASHCFGCTAGAGSSCTGALT